jgi:hypothetical protein
MPGAGSYAFRRALESSYEQGEDAPRFQKTLSRYKAFSEPELALKGLLGNAVNFASSDTRNFLVMIVNELFADPVVGM